MKVKLFLFLIKNHAMKPYGRVDIQLHTFLTSSHALAALSQKGTPVSTGQEAGEVDSLCLCQELNPDCLGI
jgi:hypothetical protein